MGIIKTKGIILSESKMNDYDKMITILTPNGKIGCPAKGQETKKPSYGRHSIFVLWRIFIISGN